MLLDMWLKISPMDSKEHRKMDYIYFHMIYISLYQMLIRSKKYAVNMGRYSVQYDTNTLEIFVVKQREGNLKGAIQFFGCLK